MCSIIGSYSKDKLEELAKLNKYRGEHSHSLFVICPETYDILFQHKGLGSLNLHEREIPSGYIIAHQQAPTSENRDGTIHPAVWRSDYLWHNGIIKKDCVNKLQEIHKTEETWDTKLILWNLTKLHFPLANIDGSFSCLWKSRNNIFLFRNEISPMFMDDDFNISSTKFKNGTAIPANIMWDFNIKDKQFVAGKNFITVNNPYWGVM